MAKNNLVRDVSTKSIFPSAQAVTNATVSYDQGDLLYFDTVNFLVKKPAAETDCVTFCGVALETVVNGKIKRPYTTDVDASQAISDLPGPAYGSVFKFIAKTGDAFNPGDVVYGDPVSGSRNVQAAGTKAIGIYQGPVIASAAAGQEIEVLVGTRFPADALKF